MHRLKFSSEPSSSAQAVGLRYVSDAVPGIHRAQGKKGFRYFEASKKLVRDKATLARIKALSIPPAWTQVWICPFASGHLQATGRDDRGRKQYRYHPRWREVRDQTKYLQMTAFGRALPAIRRRVARDLRRSGLPRKKVLAAIVKLLEVSHIRVGNDEYARANKSFGLTTMRNNHVQAAGAKLRFQFRGKSAKFHNVTITHRRLAKVVRNCQGIPGQHLFQYLDEKGHPQNVDSGGINDYLRAITGANFTAKDFRTWAGTALAVMALCEHGSGSDANAKKNVRRAVEKVAETLGNTPAVCRQCYIHPAIFEFYRDGSMLKMLRRQGGTRATRSPYSLRPEEVTVLTMLQQSLARQKSGNHMKKQLERSLRKIQRRG